MCVDVNFSFFTLNGVSHLLEQNQDLINTGFVAIVGRPNVGKSTLLNHLIGQKISITSKKAQTTRQRVNGIYTDETSQFIFVDTPGFQTQYSNMLNDAMNKSVKQTLQDVDVVLFVIEAMRFGPRDIEVLRLLPTNRPVILVVNKVDNLENRAEVLPFLQTMQTHFPFAAMVPVSAQHGQQMDTLLDTVRPYLPLGQRMYDEDAITDRSERFLAAELVREKIFRLLGDELPYAMTVDIEKFEIEGSMRRIHAIVYVDKPSQKAIILGKDGEKMKKIATQARLDMEKLFDNKVFLQVWVKVKNGWADDTRLLRQFGVE